MGGNKRGFISPLVLYIMARRKRRRILDESYEVDPYGILDNNMLQQYARKLSKRANQRMLRLERAKSNITGESYASYGAYVNYAQWSLTEGKRRFEENYKGWGDNPLRLRIARLQQFLNAESSTVSGQRAIERRRIETFSSGKWKSGRYADDLANTQRKIVSASNSDFYDFLNSKTFQDLMIAGFTSEQAIELYDELYEQYGEDAADKLGEAFDKWQAAENDAKGYAEMRSFSGLRPLV